jgi:hypothetical protein
MNNKKIEFEDGSWLEVVIGDNKMTITLQAKHMGENKVTSTNVVLSPEQTIDLVNWIGDELVKEFSNEL